ncbi:MAG: hypothetical protein ACHQET_10665 [Chitinophagales bacterium]
MSSIEPEARSFLRKIAWSVFFGILWMMFNMTLGIYYGLLFAENGVGIWNILYYVLFLVSLFLLIRYYLRTWKQKFPHG